MGGEPGRGRLLPLHRAPRNLPLAVLCAAVAAAVGAFAALLGLNVLGAPLPGALTLGDGGAGGGLRRPLPVLAAAAFLGAFVVVVLRFGLRRGGLFLDVARSELVLQQTGGAGERDETRLAISGVREITVRRADDWPEGCDPEERPYYVLAVRSDGEERFLAEDDERAGAERIAAKVSAAVGRPFEKRG